MIIKKVTARGQAGRSKNKNFNRTIQCLCENCKRSVKRTAVLAKSPYFKNGFRTSLIELDRYNFQLGTRGIWHASGIFFALDRLNFRAAKQFLSEVAAS